MKELLFFTGPPVVLCGCLYIIIYWKAPKDALKTLQLSLGSRAKGQDPNHNFIIEKRSIGDLVSIYSILLQHDICTIHKPIENMFVRHKDSFGTNNVIFGLEYIQQF